MPRCGRKRQKKQTKKQAREPAHMPSPCGGILPPNTRKGMPLSLIHIYWDRELAAVLQQKLPQFTSFKANGLVRRVDGVDHQNHFNGRIGSRVCAALHGMKREDVQMCIRDRRRTAARSAGISESSFHSHRGQSNSQTSPTTGARSRTARTLPSSTNSICAGSVFRSPHFDSN